MDPAAGALTLRFCTVEHSTSGLWEHPKFRFIFLSHMPSSPIDVERVIEATQMRSTGIGGFTPSEPAQSLQARTIVQGPG
jgi:hypothetical protein